MYAIDRSNVLETVLRNEGWTQAHGEESPLFSYALRPVAGFRNIPIRWANKYTAKVEFSQQMKCLGIERVIPPTYEDLDDLPDIASGELWFVKESLNSRGRGITPVRSLHDMKVAASRLPKGSYVLQQGVTNLDLYKGKKYTLRVYILQLPDGRVWVYRRIVGIQHKLEYDRSTASHDIHVSHTGAQRYDFEAEHPKYKVIFDRIVQATKEVFGAWRGQMDFNGAGYHFYGADFLVDRNYNVWLLELNSFPDVSSKQEDVRHAILVDFFTDLYRLVIAPATTGATPVLGKFAIALPSLPTIKKSH